MTVTLPNKYLAMPVPDRLRGNLLDVATITEDLRWMDTEAIGLSYNCLTTNSQATWPCPATLLAAPVQAASTTATTGGTLAAGTYRIRVTAVNARGETDRSNEITRVTTGSTSTITVNWANVSGETGYRIYVSPVGGAAGTERYVTQVAADVVTYVWTGTPAADPTRLAPTTNTAVVNVTKVFNSPEWQDGFRFQTYAGVICESVGFDMDDAVENAKRVFLAKESNAVEQALMAQRFIASATNWAAPTDVTPASGAVKPAVGLALLEQHAGMTYAGAPTIHAPRSIGALLMDTAGLKAEGNIFRSPQGSKVASGAGYGVANQSPAGVAAPAGELWVYATGEVSVARGALITPEAQLNRDNNEVTVLVERPYIAVVDCYAAAVRVKVE
jgi:hypothetical protein